MKKSMYLSPVCAFEFVDAEDMITTSLTKGITLDLDSANTTKETVSWGNWT